ncbi:MAG: hypothetical protein RL264_1013 [Bacteroidota bacterium]|jgi:hypothetical protein
MDKLREDKINYANIGLMFLTAVLAYFFPFETFLLAYAYLGPLHYLTEISWLHDRNYYSKGKYDFVVLVIVGVLLSYAAFAKDFNMGVEFYDYFVEMNLFDKLVVFALFSSVLFALVKNLYVKLVAILLLYVFISGWLTPERTGANQSTTVFALTSLVPTLIHVYVFTGLFMLFGSLKTRSKSGMWAMAAFVIIPVLLVFALPVSKKGNLSEYGKKAYYADGNGFYFTNLSILNHFDLIPKVTNKEYVDEVIYGDDYLPDSTKYSFTLNQEFGGKTYAVAGKDSIVTFSMNGNKYQDIVWTETNPVALPSQKYLDSLYPIYKSNLLKEISAPLLAKADEQFVVMNPESELYRQPLNYVQMFPAEHKKMSSFIYFSEIGIMLMRFIAFAYLYHYLNWFSKTEVIRWHKVPKLRFMAVILLWIISSVFYFYDYSLGLSLLFFLSFSHVLLEFPLNIVSIVGIGKEGYSILTKGFSKG